MSKRRSVSLVHHDATFDVDLTHTTELQPSESGHISNRGSIYHDATFHVDLTQKTDRIDQFSAHF